MLLAERDRKVSWVSATFDIEKLVSETADGVVCLAERGDIVYANRAAERMFALPSGALVGRRWQSLVKMADGTLASKTPARGRGVRSDGSTFELELTLTPLAPFHAAIIRDLSVCDRTLRADELAA